MPAEVRQRLAAKKNPQFRFRAKNIVTLELACSITHHGLANARKWQRRTTSMFGLPPWASPDDNFILSSTSPHHATPHHTPLQPTLSSLECQCVDCALFCPVHFVPTVHYTIQENWEDMQHAWSWGGVMHEERRGKWELWDPVVRICPRRPLFHCQFSLLPICRYQAPGWIRVSSNTANRSE